MLAPAGTSALLSQLGLRSHMKRPVKLLQVLRLVRAWFDRFVVVSVGCRGRAGLASCPGWLPDRASRRPGSQGRGALARDAAGTLDAGSGEPMMGAARGMGIPGVTSSPGRGAGLGAGVAYRDGVAAAAVTATLIYAGRDRRPVSGRMVPLTPDESRGCVHRSDGDRSCHGERPGTPPARGGHVVGQGFMPGRRSSRPRRTRRARGRPR